MPRSRKIQLGGKIKSEGRVKLYPLSVAGWPTNDAHTSCFGHFRFSSYTLRAALLLRDVFARFFAAMLTVSGGDERNLVSLRSGAVRRFFAVVHRGHRGVLHFGVSASANS